MRYLLLLLLVMPFVLGQEPAPQPEPMREPEDGPRRIIVLKPEPGSEEVSVFIPLESLTYEEAEPFIRPMLSPKGMMGYLRRRNSLVVHDRQEVVDKVRAFLESIDRKAVNVRLTVEFANDYMQEGTHLGAVFDDDPGGPKVIIEDGKVHWPEKVEITGNQTSREGSRGTTQQILTLSGSPAQIWVGRQIPDPTWLRRFTFRPLYAGPHSTVIVRHEIPPTEWRDVGASLYVLPVYQDNGLISVDLYPVVTYHDREGKRHSFRVEEVRSSLVVQPGQRVHIGGNTEATQDFMRQLLGPELYNRQERSNVLGIYLTAEVQKPGGRER